LDTCREDAAKGLLDFLSTGFSEGPDGFNICFFASLPVVLHLVCLLLRWHHASYLSIFTAIIMASCSRSHEYQFGILQDESIVYITPCAICQETEKKVRYHSHMRLFSHHLSTHTMLRNLTPNARIRISSKGRFHTKRASAKKPKAKKERKCKSTSTSSEQCPQRLSKRLLISSTAAHRGLTTPSGTQPTQRPLRALGHM